MLADGSEARIRAEKPKEETELRRLIKDTIDGRVACGQLDDTDLTLNDLSEILESFTATLRGIYHPRVKYPKLEDDQIISSEPTVPITSATSDPSTSEVQLGSSLDTSSPTS